MATLFDYAMRYRPPSYATVPVGYHSFLPKTGQHPFGGVRYERQLTDQEIGIYQLVPLDPSHPLNMQAEFDVFHKKFLAAMSEGAEAYRIGSTHLVTASLVPGIDWQLTALSEDGRPTRHTDFCDFDKLARAVWEIEKNR